MAFIPKLYFRHFRRRLRKATRRVFVVALMRLIRIEQYLFLTGRRVLNFIIDFLATIMGLLIAILLIWLWPASKPIEHIDELHFACAGIFGGALALVLSLSIIPAQKAAESFSTAILKLYARDNALLFVFALLSIATMISVLQGAGWEMGMTASFSLGTQLIIMGFSFDGLRLFYRRTLNLLIADTAVALVINECNRSIKRVEKSVERLVYVLRVGGGSTDLLAGQRAVLYAQSQIASAIRIWLGELDEFAHKAINRGDTRAVNQIVTAMQSIGLRYADTRRTSVILVPDWNNLFSGGTSDISKVLSPIHENIRVICQHAANQTNELIVSHCIRTLGAMTEHAITVVHDQNRGKTTPLAHSPCFYLKLCMQIAAKAKMEDAVLTSVESLKSILLKPTREIDTTSVEGEALDSLFLIVIASYGNPDSVTCFPAVEAMLFAARHNIRIRGYRQQSTLKKVLEKLVLVMPFEVVMEKAGKRVMSTFPAYSMGFEANVPALLELVAHQVTPPDADRHWENSFAAFLEVSEDIVRHYRELANKTDFQNALLRKWVSDSVITCAKVHIALMDAPPAGGDVFLHEVDNRLQWYIHALTYFFQQQNPFPSDHAEDACGDLAILGMMLLERDWLESASACGVAIKTIAKNCAESQHGPYALANLEIKLEILARAASAYGYNALATDLRRQIQKPETTSAEVWTVLRHELATRVRQLNDDLTENNRGFALHDDPVQMLQAILSRAQTEDGDTA